jgi:hypothetical protein
MMEILVLRINFVDFAIGKYRMGFSPKRKSEK